MAKFDGILDRFSPDEQQQLIRYYDNILHSVRSRPRPPSWVDFAGPHKEPSRRHSENSHRPEKEKRRGKPRGSEASRPLAARPSHRTIHPADLPDEVVDLEDNNEANPIPDANTAAVEQNSIDKCRRWLMRSDFDIRHPSDL